MGKTPDGLPFSLAAGRTPNGAPFAAGRTPSGVPYAQTPVIAPGGTPFGVKANLSFEVGGVVVEEEGDATAACRSQDGGGRGEGKEGGGEMEGGEVGKGGGQRGRDASEEAGIRTSHISGARSETAQEGNMPSPETAMEKQSSSLGKGRSGGTGGESASLMMMNSPGTIMSHANSQIVAPDQSYRIWQQTQEGGYRLSQKQQRQEQPHEEEGGMKQRGEKEGIEGSGRSTREATIPSLVAMSDSLPQVPSLEDGVEAAKGEETMRSPMFHARHDSIQVLSLEYFDKVVQKLCERPRTRGFSH